MFWPTLITVVILATVARARAEGIDWIEIAAFPSQWVRWVLFGEGFGATMSSCIALHVRDGHRYRPMWLALKFVVDVLFLWRERHHCDNCLHRFEKKRLTWT